MRCRRRSLLAIGAAMTLSSSPLFSQAFTAPQGLGSLTIAWQYVDNTGHRFSDGFLLRRGESVTTSLLLEADYGITDRLSATVGVPYVFAKYSGTLPPAGDQRRRVMVRRLRGIDRNLSDAAS